VGSGYNWTIIQPAELSAAAVLISYWTDINGAAWIALLLVVVAAINMLGARGVGFHVPFPVLPLLTPHDSTGKIVIIPCALFDIAIDPNFLQRDRVLVLVGAAARV
jgi:hypothetical protein